MLARFWTGRFLSTLLLWEGLEPTHHNGPLPPCSDSLCWDVHLLGVCMPLWPSWARGPVFFFFRKKKTNAKQRHLTESSRRISIVRHHFSASQRIAAYLRVISQGSRNGPRNGPQNIPNPNRGKFRSGRLGSQADSAKCGFRPLAENLGCWRSQLPTAARPWGLQGNCWDPQRTGLRNIAESYFQLRRDQGGKVIFVRENYFLLIFKKKVFQKKSLIANLVPSVTVTL